MAAEMQGGEGVAAVPYPKLWVVQEAVIRSTSKPFRLVTPARKSLVKHANLADGVHLQSHVATEEATAHAALVTERDIA